MLLRLDRVALGSAAVLLACVSFRCIWEADWGWQIATGDWVAAHGPPKVDPFSFAGPPREWIELRWLYALLLHGVVHVSGPAGAIVLKTLALAATFALAAASTGAGASAAVIAPLLVLAILASSLRFFVRPEIVTYLFLASFLWAIERHRRGDRRFLRALPLLQLVWVNSHTLFVLGPVTLGLHVVAEAWHAVRASRPAERARAAERLRAAALATGLGVLACLANPWGLRGALFPFRLLAEIRGSLFKTVIGEFASPFALSTHYGAVTAYEALLALCVLSAAANLRRLDPFRTLQCAATAYLSTLAMRNVPLFAISAIPFVAGNVAELRLPAPLVRSRVARALRAALPCAVIAACLATSRGFVTNRAYVAQADTNRFGFGIAPNRYPMRGATFLKEHGLGPSVFATMLESSWLLSQGFRVFIDPRLEVYGEAHFARYLNALAGDDVWRSVAAEYDLRAALVDLDQTSFLERTLRSGEWKLVFWDECTAMIARRDVASVPAIATDADWARSIAVVREDLPAPRAWEDLGAFGRATSPTPYHRVANFLMTMGRPDGAEAFLRDALTAYPASARARITYARLLERRGDRAGAAREIERAYASDPADPEVASQSALQVLQDGDAARALERLGRVLQAHPDHAVSWAISGEAHLARHETAEAVECFERAVRLDPANAYYATRLAAARSSR
ncbi:MAG: tetratricopeptide repeat protein [bacterium]